VLLITSGEERDCGGSIFAPGFEAIFRKTLGFIVLVALRQKAYKS
jgi:hypothetical protein